MWFKAPLGGSTVKGILNLGTSCYVKAFSATRVAFFLDSTALNTVTDVANGMQCMLDTTKFANGTHQLKAVAYDASSASRQSIRCCSVIRFMSLVPARLMSARK